MFFTIYGWPYLSCDLKPELCYTITSPCEPDASVELKLKNIFFYSIPLRDLQLIG